MSKCGFTNLLDMTEYDWAMRRNSRKSSVLISTIKSVRQLTSTPWPHTRIESSIMQGAYTMDKLNRSNIGRTSADGFIVKLFQSNAGFLPRAFFTV